MTMAAGNQSYDELLLDVGQAESTIVLLQLHHGLRCALRLPTSYLPKSSCLFTASHLYFLPGSDCLGTSRYFGAVRAVDILGNAQVCKAPTYARTRMPTCAHVRVCSQVQVTLTSYFRLLTWYF